MLHVIIIIECHIVSYNRAKQSKLVYIRLQQLYHNNVNIAIQSTLVQK